MEYIAHTRYDGKTMKAVPILIRRGRRLERREDVLFYDGTPVCVHRSLVGKKHFARNDDGRGMERGALTYAIAYAPRVRFGGPDGDRQQRFTDEEIETLEREWGQYLKPDVDILLFNDAFFEEDPDVLRKIAASVNIEVPKSREE